MFGAHLGHCYLVSGITKVIAIHKWFESSPEQEESTGASDISPCKLPSVANFLHFTALLLLLLLSQRCAGNT